MLGWRSWSWKTIRLTKKKKILLNAVCQCSSRFVSDSIVRVPVCVRALLRQTRCSDHFLAQIFTPFVSLSRATFLHTSMILISLSHCKIT